MQVELYEIEEVGIGQTDVPEKVEADVVAAIMELKLEGQKKLLQSFDENGEVDTTAPAKVIPFKKMNPDEERIWKGICPSQHNAESYDEGLIPLRVLSLMIACQKRGFFESYEIWSESNMRVDPILVGVKKSGKWTHDYYLLARWGESLLPQAKLAEEAVKRIIVRARANIARKLRDYQSWDKMADEMVANFIHNGDGLPYGFTQ